eukprot:UN11379
MTQHGNALSRVQRTVNSVVNKYATKVTNLQKAASGKILDLKKQLYQVHRLYEIEKSKVIELGSYCAALEADLDKEKNLNAEYKQSVKCLEDSFQKSQKALDRFRNDLNNTQTGNDKLESEVIDQP